MLWFWDSCKSVCLAACLWDNQISGDGPLKNLEVRYKSIHIHKSNCKSNRSQAISKYSPAVFYCAHVRAPASMALLLFIQDYVVRVGFPNNCVWLFPGVMEEASTLSNWHHFCWSESRVGSYNTSGINQREELVGNK